MKTEERARTMRADGATMRQIADDLSICLQHVYRLVGDMAAPVTPDRQDIVTKLVARNGACSTTSGMVPISMPRIPTLHGAFA